MTEHSKYMRRCLELARLGAGAVSPNPMVGSVIVYDGKIIGEGFHAAFGEKHAEVHAIQNAMAAHPDAAEKLKSSTLYVNLEPCSHTGKTPPCTDLIIKNQIPRVVIGSGDPFVSVNGKGIRKLREHGVEVIEKVLEAECRNLNRRFFTRVQQQRPYIILKWAQTADGRFAPTDGSKKWISSSQSKQLVHRWRSEEDAVLVGKNTAMADNPRLNVREWSGKNPVRIVIDRNLELSPDLHLFDQTQETLVLNSLKTEIIGNVKFLELENLDSLMPQMVAYQLYLRDIQSLIVEGGALVLDQFIKSGMWDEIRRFTSADRWNEGKAAPVIQEQADEVSRCGPDTLEIWYNKKQ